MGILGKIYGWEFIERKLGRAAQSEGVSKSTTDVTFLLAGVTLLLFQAVRGLFVFKPPPPPNRFICALFQGAYIGTGEFVFL